MQVVKRDQQCGPGMPHPRVMREKLRNVSGGDMRAHTKYDTV